MNTNDLGLNVFQEAYGTLGKVGLPVDRKQKPVSSSETKHAFGSNKECLQLGK